MHSDRMGVQITIRDVPNSVRDELAARAAAQGRSMQEFLRGELERLASRPSMETLLKRIRERVNMAGTTVSADEILADLHADRQ